MTDKQEVWKDIPSFKGFLQASNLGRIREYIVVKVKGSADIVYKNRIVNITYPTNPYPIPKIFYKGTKCAARLIAEAWMKDFDKKLFIGFKDGNYKNTNPDNLIMRKSCPNPVTGHNNWQAKLDNEKILEIIQMIKDHNSARTIAEKFGIHPQNVYRIAGNKIWKHVKREVIYFKKTI